VAKTALNDLPTGKDKLDSQHKMAKKYPSNHFTVFWWVFMFFIGMSKEMTFLSVNI